jgi:hypothetical protein
MLAAFTTKSLTESLIDELASCSTASAVKTKKSSIGWCDGCPYLPKYIKKKRTREGSQFSVNLDDSGVMVLRNQCF